AALRKRQRAGQQTLERRGEARGQRLQRRLQSHLRDCQRQRFENIADVLAFDRDVIERRDERGRELPAEAARRAQLVLEVAGVGRNLDVPRLELIVVLWH